MVLSSFIFCMRSKKQKSRGYISNKLGGIFILFLLVIVLPLTLLVAESHTNLFNYAQVAIPACHFMKADQPVNVAFCDSFDSPQSTGNRSGALNGLIWGVS